MIITKNEEQWTAELEKSGYISVPEISNQLARWSSKLINPLYVKGLAYSGNSKLVDGIIQILDSENTELHNRITEVSFWSPESFEDLFYKWDGRKRKIGLDLEKDSNYLRACENSSEFVEDGCLYRMLKEDSSVQYLIIRYYGNSPGDGRTDQALAEFIENKTIEISKTGETKRLSDDRKLFIFIIENSCKQSEFYRG